MTIQEASDWASHFLKKDITPSNISYLIQYGRIAKIGENGSTRIKRNDLEEYYNAYHKTKEKEWKKRLGKDLNWNLSFAEYKESERTKHVHRLHPYKGKFIPQLVEYFLDEHRDTCKTRSFFKAGNIILDPFCGSGTTLVQANELGLHAIGIDVSAFNAFISNCKLSSYDILAIERISSQITQELVEFQKKRNFRYFEASLTEELKNFNAQFFPSPEFKYKIRHKKIDESSYGKEKSEQFLELYNRLVKKYKLPLKQKKSISFLDRWFLQIVRDEINFIFDRIQSLTPEKNETKKILALILSRTLRSSRATTHADLGTLKEPVTSAYYCKKHGKICKPLFSVLSHWKRYSQDSIKRIREFESLKTETFQRCLVGDSRNIDLLKELRKEEAAFSQLIKKNKIDGIFSSPPYVGLIDYHEQHAYAYDLFAFEKNESLEIGPLYKGQGKEARKSYIQGISEVLRNSKKFLKKDYDVFLVANDKYGLYPKIAELSKMEIVKQYKRPVLNRVEKDRSAYSEIIFHLKEKAVALV